MQDWMSKLLPQEVPGAMEGQAKLAEQAKQAIKNPSRTVTKAADNSRISYTPRDHDTLYVILAHPMLGTDLNEGITTPDGEPVPRYCEVSNSKLAFALGMSAGAAAARVARLVKMGVLKPWYDVSVETGRVNRRILEVLEVPPTPWSPK